MPTTLRANCIGSLAAQALSIESSGVIGEVVSTFSNAFYVGTASGELLFITNRSLRSPITINLDSASNLECIVAPLQPVYIQEKQIRVGEEASIDLSRALSHHSRSYIGSQPSPGFVQIGRWLHIVSFILRIIDTSQSVLDPHGLAHEGAADFVRDGVITLRRSNTERFREAALEMVGLGSGFTPSGDDVLGGFLAAYNALAQTVGRAPILLDFAVLRRKTSWLSAKLLDYMQRLVLDDQMDHMVRSAARGDGEAVTLALETLLPRGHTSGIDISTGAILAVSLLRDIALQKHETETITSRLGLSSRYS